MIQNCFFWQNDAWTKFHPDQKNSEIVEKWHNFSVETNVHWFDVCVEKFQQITSNFHFVFEISDQGSDRNGIISRKDDPSRLVLQEFARTSANPAILFADQNQQLSFAG